MKKNLLVMTMILFISVSNSQEKKVLTIEKQKNEVTAENIKENDVKATEKELNEVLYTDQEIESALKFSQEYWLGLKGKTLKEVIETSVKPQERSIHRKRKTRRQTAEECNPFHIRWWKR